MLKGHTLKAYAHFEKAIVFSLLAMLAIMVLWATGTLALEIVVRIGRQLLGQPDAPAEVAAFFERLSVMHDVYGAFLLILIGIELMKTIMMYLEHHVFHVEVVFTVAMIAIARHAIDLDLERLEPLSTVGMGVLILSLTGGFFIYRKSMSEEQRRTT